MQPYLNLTHLSMNDLRHYFSLFLRAIIQKVVQQLNNSCICWCNCWADRWSGSYWRQWGCGERRQVRTNEANVWNPDGSNFGVKPYSFGPLAVPNSGSSTVESTTSENDFYVTTDSRGNIGGPCLPSGYCQTEKYRCPTLKYSFATTSLIVK